MTNDEQPLRLTFTTQTVEYHGWTLERGATVAIKPLALGILTGHEHVQATAIAANRDVMIPVAALPADQVVA